MTIVQDKNLQKLSIIYFEKYVLSTVFLFQALVYIYKFNNHQNFNLIYFLNSFIKPLFFSIFLYQSANSSRKVSVKSALGLLLSFVPLYWVKVGHTNFSVYTNIIIYSGYIFYFSFFALSFFNLGKSFSIIPSVGVIKNEGVYRVIRHPLYSSYLHLFFIFLISNFNAINLIICFFLATGLYLRASEEEKLLSEKDISYFIKLPNARFFSPWISFPLLILILSIFLSKSDGTSKLKVNIAYPVYSITPLGSDDWSSFFVINHIYPRFISRESGVRSNSLFQNLIVRCKDSGKTILSANCEQVEVFFTLKDKLKSCSGVEYTFSNFKNELEQIVSSKNWIFPNFSWCEDNRCFRFNNVHNISNRFESIYLRFGWSVDNSSSKIFGIYPNCFTPEDKELPFQSGKIILPDRVISVSTRDEKQDLYLYGNSSHKKPIQNLSYYNPIYYFLITNGYLGRTRKPMFNKKEIEIIKSVLEGSKIIDNNLSNDSLRISSVMSSGKSLRKRIEKHNVVLPDYWSNCEEIESKLNSSSYLKLKYRFVCSNISLFVEQIVKKNKSWDSYLTPLTPGFPGKDALMTQYFDPASSDNWLGKTSPETSLVNLIGISNSFMQKATSKICSLKTNALGLSDFVIDDMVFCD